MVTTASKCFSSLTRPLERETSTNGSGSLCRVAKLAGFGFGISGAG